MRNITSSQIKSHILATQLAALYSFGLAYRTYGYVTRVRYLSNLLEGTLKLLHVVIRVSKSYKFLTRA